MFVQIFALHQDMSGLCGLFCFLRSGHPLCQDKKHLEVQIEGYVHFLKDRSKNRADLLNSHCMGVAAIFRGITLLLFVVFFLQKKLFQGGRRLRFR